jgi:hypothetical protein
MPWTNASIVLNSRDATNGTYNALKFNANNQNIIQGQIHSISVNEVNFPYDIPNVQKGPDYLVFSTAGAGLYNSFELVNATFGNLEIVIAPGFYSGAELQTAIQAKITAAGAAHSPPLLPADLPSFVYNDVSNTFFFQAPVTTTGSYTNWFCFSPYANPPAGKVSRGLGKDLLTIMGFPVGLGQGFNVDSNPANPQGKLFIQSGSAPLQFTQYVDICSPLLCQYQYFRDGSTTNLARQSDVICRLYISNNVATQEQEGQRPFVIQRQFNNARVMRWSSESSVGTIDINLFDDVGQPLLYTWQPRPYQITFNCYEQDKDSTTY